MLGLTKLKYSLYKRWNRPFFFFGLVIMLQTPGADWSIRCSRTSTFGRSPSGNWFWLWNSSGKITLAMPYRWTPCLTNLPTVSWKLTRSSLFRKTVGPLLQNNNSVLPPVPLCAIGSRVFATKLMTNWLLPLGGGFVQASQKAALVRRNAGLWSR